MRFVVKRVAFCFIAKIVWRRDFKSMLKQMLSEEIRLFE